MLIQNIFMHKLVTILSFQFLASPRIPPTLTGNQVNKDDVIYLIAPSLTYFFDSNRQFRREEPYGLHEKLGFVNKA